MIRLLVLASLIAISSVACQIDSLFMGDSSASNGIYDESMGSVDSTRASMVADVQVTEADRSLDEYNDEILDAEAIITNNGPDEVTVVIYTAMVNAESDQEENGSFEEEEEIDLEPGESVEYKGSKSFPSGSFGYCYWRIQAILKGGETNDPNTSNNYDDSPPFVVAVE